MYGLGKVNKPRRSDEFMRNSNTVQLCPANRLMRTICAFGCSGAASSIAFLKEGNRRSEGLRFPGVVRALANLPDDTVTDGEVVALDEHGRPLLTSCRDSVPGS